MKINANSPPPNPNITTPFAKIKQLKTMETQKISERNRNDIKSKDNL